MQLYMQNVLTANAISLVKSLICLMVTQMFKWNVVLQISIQISSIQRNGGKGGKRIEISQTCCSGYVIGNNMAKTGSYKNNEFIRFRAITFIQSFD